MKRKEITNMIYGGLIPQRCLPRYKNSKTYWECECLVCNQNKIIPLETIQKKPISCGCIKEDLTGMRFGHLLITGMIPGMELVTYFCEKCETTGIRSTKGIKSCTQCVTCAKEESQEKGCKSFSVHRPTKGLWNNNRTINENKQYEIYYDETKEMLFAESS